LIKKIGEIRFESWRPARAGRKSLPGGGQKSFYSGQSGQEFKMYKICRFSLLIETLFQKIEKVV